MEFKISRNPYFIGILSAILKENLEIETILEVAILILLESFLQYRPSQRHIRRCRSRNPYFIGILSAIKNC